MANACSAVRTNFAPTRRAVPAFSEPIWLWTAAGRHAFAASQLDGRDRLTGLSPGGQPRARVLSRALLLLLFLGFLQRAAGGRT